MSTQESTPEKTPKPTPEIDFPTAEDFETLLNESLGEDGKFEGRVAKGTVISIESDYAIIDIGLKAEGRVALREFTGDDGAEEINVGDTVEVFVDRIENAVGEAVLSRDKARREESWEQLEKAYAAEERVEGIIFGRVKGGFTVDLSGAIAFLPGSQVDVRPIRDVTPLMNIPQPFQILKMDRKRGNIVVSRRAILEETRAEQRSEVIENISEGDTIEGIVKNITEYGAFIDLGGIDGLLHVTDMSWGRVNHPSEVLGIGETVKVQVIRVNKETQRISLGLKQLEADPWDGIDAKYPVSTKFTGRITNITDYGAFVELEPGVEGLVHVSEMSWVKKNIHPGKIVSTSQEVEVMVLEVDPDRRRISLGLKQCGDNPWANFSEQYPVGTTIEGEVRNVTEFGIFIGLDNGVDGMVHLSDLAWGRSGEEALAEFQKGSMVKAVVLDVDTTKERISLGIKQLSDDPFAALAGKKKGSAVTCTVSAIESNGIEVMIGDSGVKAFIRRGDLSRDRNEQRPDRFAVGEKVDAMVTGVDKATRRVSLSVKALQISDEKAAVEQYGSSDSGASLGDILGAALKAKKDAGDTKEKPSKAEKKAAKKPAAKKAEKDEAADEAKEAKEPKEEKKKPAKAKETKKASTAKKAAPKDKPAKKSAKAKDDKAADKPAKKTTAKKETKKKAKK